MKNTVFVIWLIFALNLWTGGCDGRRSPEQVKAPEADSRVFSDSVWFEYTKITGIGYEKGVSRRDPSDIIKVGDTYYVWYTKIPAFTGGEPTPLYPSGYYGTIWYAISTDKGRTWTERGQALGAGPVNAFDSHAVFTPNILFDHGKYYLFYTGVRPTPGKSPGTFENNSINDFTAIGLAVSGSPDGPFVRIRENPVLEVSRDPSVFDSYRVDDAALLVRDGKYMLYYKGRSMKYKGEGPRHTMMGVAVATQADGPYRKVKEPLLDNSHEVLIWNVHGGVFALASISSTLEFAPDGLNFGRQQPAEKKISHIPSAPGLFRPHLTDHSVKKIPGWGISMMKEGKDIYLVRFELKKKSISE